MLRLKLGLKEIIFDKTGLDDEKVIFILEAFLNYSKIPSVSFANCKVKSIAFKSLSTFMHKVCVVSDIRCEFIVQAPFLVHLDLSGMAIEKKDIILIARGLGYKDKNKITASNLKSLVLDNCKLKSSIELFSKFLFYFFLFIV